MKAAQRNSTSRFALGVRTAVRRAGLPVALLSVAVASLVPGTLLPGSPEFVVLMSQTVSAGAVLGLLYRWVRQGRPQPAYVRVRV